MKECISNLAKLVVRGSACAGCSGNKPQSELSLWVTVGVGVRERAGQNMINWKANTGVWNCILWIKKWHPDSLHCTLLQNRARQPPQWQKQWQCWWRWRCWWTGRIQKLQEWWWLRRYFYHQSPHRRELSPFCFWQLATDVYFQYFGPAQVN